MIGWGPLGGTCVNVGCVPSKYLIEAASAYRNAKEPVFPGLTAMASLSFPWLMESLKDIVKSERKSKYEEVLKKYENIEYYSGNASFIDSNRVTVQNGDKREEVSAFNFLVATGSRPAAPRIIGLEDSGYMTSNEIWNIKDLPARMTVLGAGAVGSELAQAFHSLGSDVTLVEAMPSVLYGFEPEISKAILDVFEGDGMEVYLNAFAVKAEKGALYVKTGNEQKKLEHDLLLVATGRVPNVNGLGLENAGVQYTEKGIKVDRTLRTTNPRIYAAGDVVDQKLKLETVAAKEGATVAENLYENADKGIDFNAVPFAVFTQPQVASVGLKESECPGCSSRVLPLESVPKARIIRKEEGLVKLVIDENGRVLGVHAVSPFASEIIMEGVYAVKHKLSIDDIIDTSHVFPTISESIKLAAQSFRRDVSMMSCCVE